MNQHTLVLLDAKYPVIPSAISANIPFFSFPDFTDVFPSVVEFSSSSVLIGDSLSGSSDLKIVICD